MSKTEKNLVTKSILWQKMGCEDLSFLAQLSAPAPVSDLEILVNNPRNEEQLISAPKHSKYAFYKYDFNMLTL